MTVRKLEEPADDVARTLKTPCYSSYISHRNFSYFLSRGIIVRRTLAAGYAAAGEKMRSIPAELRDREADRACRYLFPSVLRLGFSRPDLLRAGDPYSGYTNEHVNCLIFLSWINRVFLGIDIFAKLVLRLGSALLVGVTYVSRAYIAKRLPAAVSRFRCHALAAHSFFLSFPVPVMETFGRNGSVLSLPIRIELPFWLSLVLPSRPLFPSSSFISHCISPLSLHLHVVARWEAPRY